MNSSMEKALFGMRIRLTLISVVTTGILLCVMAVVLLRLAENQMDLQQEASFRNSANSIIYRLQNSRSIDDAWLSQIEVGDKLLVHIEDNSRPILFRGSWIPKTDRGTLIARAHEKALSEFAFDVKTKPWSVLSTEDVTFELRGDQKDDYRVIVSLIPSGNGWHSLTLLKDLESVRNSKYLLRISFFAVIFVSLMLLLMISLVLSRRATTQIADANKKHIEFIAAASHELRAPLTVVKASLKETGNEKYRTIAEREIRRMTRLIDELLLLANVDAQKLSLKTGSVDLDTVLTELYENFEVIARNKNQKLSLSLPDYSLPMISGDKQRLSQAFTAILDNAVAYAPESGHIDVSAKKEKQTLIIEIADDGPGIKDSEKPRVFDRFYMADSSRHDKEHYGLGLSVAKEIIELHNGKITVSDSKKGGAVFTVRFTA